MLVLSIFMHKIKHFSFAILFTSESGEGGGGGMDRDVFDTVASRVSLVRDVLDTNCSAQNGSGHGHVFETFKRQLTDSFSLMLERN